MLAATNPISPPNPLLLDAYSASTPLSTQPKHTGMKRLLSILLLCVMAGVALAEREPLTKDGLQQRLSAFAEQYKAVGSIARMINHDLAFPRNASEYRIMNGFGIMWVTAHSQKTTDCLSRTCGSRPLTATL